jgi:hypothetical protein
MMRYILKSINTVNLILGAALLLMVGYLLLPLNRAKTVIAPQIQPAAKQAAVQQAPEEQPNAAADYVVIADRNLFHPERIIPVEKKEEKPLPKPDFVLYGTLIDGGTKLAFMDDLKSLYTTQGRGKRQRVIAQGENLSGFVLSEVRADRIVMARGEEKVTVLLDDKLNKRKGPAETTAPAAAAAGKQQPAAASQAFRPTATTPAAAPAVQNPEQTYRQNDPDALRRRFRSIKKQN